MNSPLDDNDNSEYISLTVAQVKSFLALGKNFISGMGDTIGLDALDGSIALVQGFESFLAQDKVKGYLLGTASIRVLRRWFLFSFPKDQEERDLRDFIEFAAKICPEKIFNYDPNEIDEYADAHKWWASIIKKRKTGV